MNDNELTKKRFLELSHRSYNAGIFEFTDFLSLSEQSELNALSLRGELCRFECFGGANGCERVVARFGDEEAFGYSVPFPIVLIKAEPVSQKFADKLTHRDILGALMNLGITRSVTGDIILIDNVAYIFALEGISDFIVESLKVAKHTSLRCSVIDTLPEGELFKTERRTLVAVGERADAIIAKLFSLSRDEATALFNKGLVFIGGRECTNRSRELKENERVSVRGYGRFIYRGYASTTKKGKLNIEVEIYI
jgi:RNA-binding protein YlmH